MIWNSTRCLKGHSLSQYAPTRNPSMLTGGKCFSWYSIGNYCFKWVINSYLISCNMIDGIISSACTICTSYGGFYPHPTQDCDGILLLHLWINCYCFLFVHNCKKKMYKDYRRKLSTSIMAGAKDKSLGNGIKYFLQLSKHCQRASLV